LIPLKVSCLSAAGLIFFRSVATKGGVEWAYEDAVKAKTLGVCLVAKIKQSSLLMDAMIPMPDVDAYGLGGVSSVTGRRWPVFVLIRGSAG
jgi:hypothetical protein